MARKASLDYLNTLYDFSHQRSPKPTLMTQLKHFLEFGDSILDRFASLLGDINKHNFDTTQLNQFADQSNTGKGAVLFCSHLGNAEIATVLETQTPNVRFNILIHTQHAEKINHLLGSISTRQQCHFWQVTQISIEMAILFREKINQGEWVVIACDRTPATGTTRITTLPFLGRPARFAQGPFILAALLECPVYTLFCCKTNSTHYRIIFEKFADTLKCSRHERESLLRTAQVKYVKLLEEAVIQYPLQWFNFFKFWG